MKVNDRALVVVSSPDTDDPLKVAVTYAMADPLDYERRLMLADVLSERGSRKAAGRQRELVACLKKCSDLKVLQSSKVDCTITALKTGGLIVVECVRMVRCGLLTTKSFL